MPDWMNVSRETLQHLLDLVALVEKWTPAINLVSKATMPHLWQRHILDSAQLFPLIPPAATSLLDLGSGGGFPGLVLAIMARDAAPELHVTLVESDQRKATFLAEARRQLHLSSTIAVQRIEALAPQNADVLTARAVAPLAVLCGYANRHLRQGGVALFAKGAQVDDEIAEARLQWRFNLTRHPSKSDPVATILALTDVCHV